MYQLAQNVWFRLFKFIKHIDLWNLQELTGNFFNFKAYLEWDWVKWFLRMNVCEDDWFFTWKSHFESTLHTCFKIYLFLFHKNLKIRSLNSKSIHIRFISNYVYLKTTLTVPWFYFMPTVVRFVSRNVNILQKPLDFSMSTHPLKSFLMLKAFELLKWKLLRKCEFMSITARFQYPVNKYKHRSRALFIYIFLWCLLLGLSQHLMIFSWRNILIAKTQRLISLKHLMKFPVFG